MNVAPGATGEQHHCLGFVRETSTGLEYVDESVRTRKRHVHFSVDQNVSSYDSVDDSLTEYDSSSDESSTGSPIPSSPPDRPSSATWWSHPPEISEESKSIMWYNDEEHEAICEQARKVSEFYYTRRHDYTTGFLSTFQYLHQCPGDDEVPGSEDLSLLAQTSARGLEIYIFPILNRCRDRAVDAILYAQANLPADMDYETKQRLLCAKSNHLSKPARRLAKILGDGDAIVAKKIREEEETAFSSDVV